MLHKKEIAVYRKNHPKFMKTLWENCRFYFKAGDAYTVAFGFNVKKGTEDFVSL
jgi:hypothetical protein